MSGHHFDLNLLPSSPISPAPAVAISSEIQPKEEPFDNWNPKFLPASASTSNQSFIPSPPTDNGDVLVRFDDPAPAPAVNAAGGSGAIVVAPTPISKRPKRDLKSFTMSAELSSFNREIVRRTRILYDSIRLAAMFEAARDDCPGIGRRQSPHLRAAALMKSSNSWLHQDSKIVGSVPGIHVGDVFFYRMEMCVLGLHGQPQAGIDYLPGVECFTGYPVATSIIVSDGYPDDEDSGEVLIYSGHGGLDKLNRPCRDQKLEGGNLAMKNSMEHGFDVRVTRGSTRNGVRCYVYDGLYRITKTWCELGHYGFSVYKFRLARIQFQEEMGSRRFALANSLMTRPLVVKPLGYLTFDLSLKEECVPLYLYNDVDSDYGPMKVKYIPKALFTVFLCQASGGCVGCECIGDCGLNCLCAIKNGGEIPYDNQGSLPRGKPIVFECGVECKCPPNCRNHVSQRGLRHRLEVFKSRETGWRVRSLELIRAGSFICEYSGVVITREQARVVGMGEDKLTYPAQFAPKWTEWGNLSRVLPTYVHPSYPSMPPLDYAIDTSTTRNVAFYMGHSSHPNVMVQYVMYDHDNLMFPHIMLFALEAIPPMRELTIDYGMPGYEMDT